VIDVVTLGGSGFKNLRDLLLFVIGAMGLAYYLVTSGDHLRLEVLAFFAGIMGAPIAFGADEKRKK
jgi:hypothetical protein